MHIEKKTIRNIFIGAAACIVLYWLLNDWDRVSRVWNFLRDILAPFVLGAALAFILNVPMRAIEGMLKGVESLKLRRALALVLTVLVILLVLAGVVMLLIPQLALGSRSLVPPTSIPPLRLSGLTSSRALSMFSSRLCWAVTFRSCWMLCRLRSPASNYSVKAL